MTNTTTALVIRRFAQHDQNICGFDRIETAQTYLAVFAWCSRFTPFTQDAPQRIRGKCPLELAGYDVSKVPMAQICRGQVLDWLPEAFGEVVPRGNGHRADAKSLATEGAAPKPLADRPPTRTAPASAQADAQPQALQARLQSSAGGYAGTLHQP